MSLQPDPPPDGFIERLQREVAKEIERHRPADREFMSPDEIQRLHDAAAKLHRENPVHTDRTRFHHDFLFPPPDPIHNRASLTRWGRFKNDVGFFTDLFKRRG